MPRSQNLEGWRKPHLANILATGGDAEGCECANHASEAPEQLGKCPDHIPGLATCTLEGSGHELRDRLEERIRQVLLVASAPVSDEHATSAVEKQTVDHDFKPSSADRTKKALDVAFRGTAAERAAGLAALPPQQRQSNKIAIKL